MIYKLEEWQSSSGLWYCEHTSSFPKDIQKWIIPSRILGISADEFIKWLIKEYKPDKIFHNENCSFVGWGWNSQSQMRKYKNYINALARKKNFQI